MNIYTFTHSLCLNNEIFQPEFLHAMMYEDVISILYVM